MYGTDGTSKPLDSFKKARVLTYQTKLDCGTAPDRLETLTHQYFLTSDDKNCFTRGNC